MFSLPLSHLPGHSRCIFWSAWWCLHRTLRFCSLFLNHLFSFCSSDLIILLSYLHIDWFFPSDCSDPPLNYSSEFFISIIVLFSSRIFHFSLGFLSLKRCFYFAYTLVSCLFPHPPLVLLASLRVVLKSFSIVSAIRSFSVDLFFPFELSILACLFVWLPIFWLSIEHFNLMMSWLWKSDSPSPRFSGFHYCLCHFVFFIVADCLCAKDLAKMST